MYIFRRLTWIDINVVNLITFTMYVFIMLFSSCLSRYMLRLTNMGIIATIFATYLQLTFLRFTLSGCKNLGISKFECRAKAQLL